MENNEYELSLIRRCRDYIERQSRDQDNTDPIGAKGISLAEEVTTFYNGDSDKIRDFHRRIEEQGLEKYAVESDSIKNAARIALKRFPELERGETIHDSEIKKRLSEVRQTGYSVPPYSHLNKEGRWNLLKEIRSDLWDKIEKTNHEVAEEIKDKNEKSKRDRHYLR